MTHLATPPSPVRSANTNRADFITALVDAIDSDRYYLTYRKRRLARDAVVGWGPRLSAYFWPKPEFGYVENVRQLAPLEAEARALIEAARPWNEATRRRAVDFAHNVFRWGSVPQENVTAELVGRVIDAAHGGVGDPLAPMNSGWTKVAAIATAHLERENGSQAIWDSRVAWSLVKRFDTILADRGHSRVPACLRGIGHVPGRGGTRWSTPLRLVWPGAYQRWDSHFAASAIVREIRDELNSRGVPAPSPDGNEGTWTVRQVEMVLFMDGY